MTPLPEPGSRTISPRDWALLANAKPSLASGARGLFEDDSSIRRLSGENAMLLGGGCALLLEVAHPLVAAGVAQHSNFRSDPLARLRNTLAALNDIVFGDLPSAVRAARRVEQSHERIRGSLDVGVGRFSAGTPYSARDPELMFWIWATLVWTSLRVSERFVASLESGERQAFYTDHCVVARILGIPVESIPSDFTRFERRFDWFCDETLAVGGDARAIADFLLDPPAGVPAGRLLRATTASLLPAAVRRAYGLDWSSGDEERLERWVSSVRTLRTETVDG